MFTQNSTTTTTNYLYDGDNAIETVDQNGNVLSKFAQGQNIDEPLAESVGGAAYDYEQDGLGSVTSLTNSSGALSLSYTYDSFGKITASSGSVSNPFRYTGRDFDSETGLYYYRARYYDPNSGKFLNEDPNEFAGGDVNFYAYVWNGPTTLVDPKGLQGGPWHPPSGVHTKCSADDECPEIIQKMWLLQRMIVSVTGWDWNMPNPRGGGRHTRTVDPDNPNNNDIAQLWKQLADCQALFAEKCPKCGPPVDVPAWKRFWQMHRAPILATGAVVAGAAAIAFAPKLVARVSGA